MREIAGPLRSVLGGTGTGAGFLLSVGTTVSNTGCFNTVQHLTPCTVWTSETCSQQRIHMTRTYSVDDVAERLGHHPESIRRNLRKGQLEGQKWQGRWVIPDESLRDWLPPAKYEEAFPVKTEEGA